MDSEEKKKETEDDEQERETQRGAEGVGSKAMMYGC